jgi:hypothetical protein
MMDFAPVDSPDGLTDPQLGYQAVEPWAIGGFLLSLLSPLALISWPLWLIAPLAAGANFVALRRLQSEPGRPGRLAAVAGLGLAFLFGVVPSARVITEWLILPDQARPVAEQFFDLLRKDQPERAVMMWFSPDSRRPFDENLWLFFRRDADARGDLLKMVDNPIVRTLLALGDRAQTRYYKSSAVLTDGASAAVLQWYTVTYADEAGKKKTFFVQVALKRQPWSRTDINPWLIKGIQSGIDPAKDAK